MATTKRQTRQALYSIILVEVTYDVDEYVDVPSNGERMVDGYHLRARVGHTVRPLHIQIGRRETRTAILVDVPASELADAVRMLECGVVTTYTADGGERYFVTQRQRGRIIRDGETSSRRNRAAA